MVPTGAVWFAPAYGDGPTGAMVESDRMRQQEEKPPERRIIQCLEVPLHVILVNSCKLAPSSGATVPYGVRAVATTRSPTLNDRTDSAVESLYVEQSAIHVFTLPNVPSAKGSRRAALARKAVAVPMVEASARGSQNRIFQVGTERNGWWSVIPDVGAFSQ
jgi:hypothetical protein